MSLTTPLNSTVGPESPPAKAIPMSKESDKRIAQRIGEVSLQGLLALLGVVFNQSSPTQARGEKLSVPPVTAPEVEGTH